MKEFEIKVKAPEGKKPVYDEKSQTITFVPINIRERFLNLKLKESNF